MRKKLISLEVLKDLSNKGFETVYDNDDVTDVINAINKVAVKDGQQKLAERFIHHIIANLSPDYINLFKGNIIDKFSGLEYGYRLTVDYIVSLFATSLDIQKLLVMFAECKYNMTRELVRISPVKMIDVVSGNLSISKGDAIKEILKAVKAGCYHELRNTSFSTPDSLNRRYIVSVIKLYCAAVLCGYVSVTVAGNEIKDIINSVGGLENKGRILTYQFAKPEDVVGLDIVMSGSPIELLKKIFTKKELEESVLDVVLGRGTWTSSTYDLTPYIRNVLGEIRFKKALIKVVSTERGIFMQNYLNEGILELIGIEDALEVACGAKKAPLTRNVITSLFNQYQMDNYYSSDAESGKILNPEKLTKIMFEDRATAILFSAECIDQRKLADPRSKKVFVDSEVYNNCDDITKLMTVDLFNILMMEYIYKLDYRGLKSLAKLNIRSKAVTPNTAVTKGVYKVDTESHVFSQNDYMSLVSSLGVSILEYAVRMSNDSAFVTNVIRYSDSKIDSALCLRMAKIAYALGKKQMGMSLTQIAEDGGVVKARPVKTLK